MSGAPPAADQPAPPRIELGSAAITTRRSTLLLRLSLWGAGLTVMTSTFIRDAWPAYKVFFDEPIPGFKHSVYNQVRMVDPAGLTLKVLSVATMSFVLLAVVSYVLARKKTTYGGVRIEGDEVVLVYSDKPARRITIAEIVSVDDAQGGLELANGTRIEISGPTREALKAELAKRRTKLDRLRAPRGILELPLKGAITGVLPWVGWFFLLGGWHDAAEQLQAGVYGPVVLVGLITAAWLGLSAWYGQTARATIGADGVGLSGRGRGRFISFARVHAIDSSSGKLTLRLTDGSAVVIGRNEAGLASRLGAAFEAYRAPSSIGAEEHAPALRRGERSREVWQAQLQKLAHRQDYRADVLDAEALASVVADARVDPEQRVAAALALPKSDEARARIRIAADSSADEDVQRALAAAADDELAEADLARAMRRRA